MKNLILTCQIQQMLGILGFFNVGAMNTLNLMFLVLNNLLDHYLLKFQAWLLCVPHQEINQKLFNLLEFISLFIMGNTQPSRQGSMSLMEKSRCSILHKQSKVEQSLLSWIEMFQIANPKFVLFQLLIWKMCSPYWDHRLCIFLRI